MPELSAQIKSLGLICALGILGFSATLHSPFHYDDAHAIVDNPYIADLSQYRKDVGIGNIFNRSILLLTFAANREVGQLDVFGFHLVNILIHICVGIVFYFLTAELISLEPPERRSRLKQLPLLASAILMVHPLTVESVTYISSRSSILATLFYVLAFYFFVRFVKLRKIGRSGFRVWYSPALALLFFFLGAGTKGIIVTLPVMAAVYLWFDSPSLNLRKALPQLFLILIPLLVYLVYRYIQLGSLLVLKADPVSLITDRGLYFLTQIHVVVFYYLFKFFLPFNLNFEPDVRLLSGILDPQWMAALGFMVALGIVIFRQESRLVRFAFVWALLTILPASSLVPLKQIAVEHRTYLPGLGIILFLGIFLCSRAWSPPKVWGQLVFLLLATLLTLNRTLDYRSEILLWQDTANKSPKKVLVHNNLATAYISANLLDNAKRELQTALDIDPKQPTPHINLGNIHAQKKDWQKALIEFDRAILLGSGKSDAFFNAGYARMKLKKSAEAIPLLQKAVQMKPLIADYHFNLGNAYRDVRMNDEALGEYRLALKIQPMHPQAQNNIGVIFWNLQAFKLAQTAFQKALEMQEDLAEVHNNLAGIYMVQRQYTKAIAHLKQLLVLQPGNAKARKLLDTAEILSRGKP